MATSADDGSDPFPMRSKEALRLSASVVNKTTTTSSSIDRGGDGRGGEGGGNKGGSNWNRMGTTITNDTTQNSRGGSSNEGGNGGTMMQDNDPLVDTDKNGTNNTTTSIYDALDKPSSSKNQRKNNNNGEEDYANIGNDDFLDVPLEKGNTIGSRDDSYTPGSAYNNNQNNKRNDLSFFESIIYNILSCFVYLSKPPKWLKNISLRIKHKLFGNDLSTSALLKILLLSSTLFFTIGGYWLLRSLKDPVLTALCGVETIPKAKMLSIPVVLGVVGVYNKLLDIPDISSRRHLLFYIFGTFYFFLFSVLAVLLNHPTLGLPNAKVDSTRILGWISYCSIESFGSVMVSLFWSYANSNFTANEAKAGYGLLIASAQIGSILGPTVVALKSKSWGIPRVYFCGALSCGLLQLCMYLYVYCYGNDHGGNNNNKHLQEDSTEPEMKKKKKGAGILEGLHLFVKHNYVKGIFAISCLFMVEVTIIDYTMKVLARNHFDKLHPCNSPEMACYDISSGRATGMSQEASDEFATFMGLFGQATNTLSLFLSFFGTSAVLRTLGLRTTLLLFPSMCLAIVISVRVHPTLYTVFAAMMILKAGSYALNNPTKEILYQPTSSSVKYKAKSWIDIFGARGSKGLGSIVTDAFSDSATDLVNKGSLVGMCVATFLIFNAKYMGERYDEYMNTGYIVGGKNDGEEYDSDDEEEEEEDREVVVHDDSDDDDDDDNDEEGGNNPAFANYKKDDRVGIEEEGQDGGEIDNGGGRDGGGSRKSGNGSGGSGGEETAEKVMKITTKFV